MTTATGAQPTNSEYYGNTYVPYPLEGIKDEHSMMQPTIGRPKPNKVEFQNNTDKRCALVLVLDKSNSMSGEPARLLNEAVAKFKSNLMEDIDVARRIDVSVVQFNHRVWLHTFRNTEVWQPPVIQPEGGTCLSAALNIAIDIVTQRSDEYRMNGISYYRPWIVLLADRYPEQDQEADLTATGVRVRQAHDQNKFNLFAITCGDANETTISLLREKITPPGRPPKKTTKTNFSELFQWLSRSLTTMTRNTTSDRISLADTSGWEIVEKPNERSRLVSTPKANSSGFHDTEDERRAVPDPAMRHLKLKQLLLWLTNEQRAAAGVPLVKMGNNPAAQLHVEAALEGGYCSHWDRWGLKPNHRYTITGGTGYDAENGSGSSYRIKPSDNYSPIQSMELKVSDTVQGWMDSPGHRRSLLHPAHTELNIGIAYDHYNNVMAQHFASDYVKYDESPTIDEKGILTISATISGATLKIGNGVNIQIDYDPPPRPLTRDQLSRTYSLCNPMPAAHVVEPLSWGRYYSDPEVRTMTVQRNCVDPYQTPAGQPAPNSPTEAHLHWAEAKSACAGTPAIQVQTVRVEALRMKIRDKEIQVQVDLRKVLATHGPGIYTVMIWGRPNHMTEITPLSKQAIFWLTRPPPEAPY